MVDIPDWIQITNALTLIVTLFVVYLVFPRLEYKKSLKDDGFDGSFRKWIVENAMDDPFYFPIKHAFLKRLFLIWIMLTITLTLMP